MAQDVATNANNLAQKDRRLVMLGRTGAGMTCTANNILHDHLFEERVDTKSKTQRCDLVQRKINNHRISIIDTPGFYNTEMSEKQTEREIDRCVSMAHPGPHAFLLVISMTNRFPPEAQNMIRHMEAKFGSDVYKYLIVIFTGKDTLDHENRHFAEFLQDGIHPMIADVLHKCNNHCVPFNNKANEQENTAQVRYLLDMVEQVVEQNGGSFYSADTFNGVSQRIRRKVASVMTRISEHFRFNIKTIFILMILMMFVCIGSSIFTATTLLVKLFNTTEANVSSIAENTTVNKTKVKEEQNVTDNVQQWNGTLEPTDPVTKFFNKNMKSYPYTHIFLSSVGRGICPKSKTRCVGYWFVLPTAAYPMQSYQYTQILLSSVKRGICSKSNKRCVGYWFDQPAVSPPLQSYPYPQILLSSVRRGICPKSTTRCVGFWFDPQPVVPPFLSYPYTQILLSSVKRGICPKSKKRCVCYWFDPPSVFPPLESYSYVQILLSSVRIGICPKSNTRCVGYWFDPPGAAMQSYPYTLTLLSSVGRGICPINSKNQCVEYLFRTVPKGSWIDYLYKQSEIFSEELTEGVLFFGTYISFISVREVLNNYVLTP